MNTTFLDHIKKAFIKFLNTGSRSNEKLKVLHGFIAADLAHRLGLEYKIKSLGFDDGKEGVIAGRYLDKNVDIAIYDSNNNPIAGIGVKFVMQNYAQNSNNYFENMLGETANIQCNQIPYFQIFIIPDCVPYYDNKGNIKKWERFNEHNVRKYVQLSRDNPDIMLHSPTKTLFYIIHIPERLYINDLDAYRKYYLTAPFELSLSTALDNIVFGKSVILNDYNTFIEKVIHRILSQ